MVVAMNDERTGKKAANHAVRHHAGTKCYLSRTSRNQKGNTKPRSCARFLDVQPIYVPANVLGLTKRKFVTHWV